MYNRGKELDRYGLKYNINTDADIIAHLETKKSIQSHIKQLIRADIAAHVGDTPERKEESV